MRPDRRLLQNERRRTREASYDLARAWICLEDQAKGLEGLALRRFAYQE